MELHKWNLTYSEAIELQNKLKQLINVVSAPLNYDLIAGADVAYDKEWNKCKAACVIYTIKENKIIEQSFAEKKITFPYVPGLLSFREVPVLLEAFNKIKTNYDIAILDGQGFAHPRRFGLASHIGLWLNKPTIGCAKSKLIGTYKIPPNIKGSWTYLCDRNEIIGVVLRSKVNTKPIFISIGNMINLKDSIDVILKCTTKYRIPEPVRYAHNFVSQLKGNKK